MGFFIGCDLGGTNLRAGLVDSDTGEVAYQVSVPTLAREGHTLVMQRMVALFRQVIAESGIEAAQVGGIGIGVPGVLDVEQGLTLFLPNLPGTWRNVALRDTISRALNLPVSLLNDARSITFGEWKFGAGKGAATMACLTLGTGVGGGLVINNQLHLERGGTAAELGHQSIDFNGPRCGCGARGCLEAYASAPALTALGVKAVIQGLTTRIGAMVDYDLNKITPKVISQAAHEGDEIAMEIFNEVGFAIGVAVSNILVTVGPSKVVLAGGMAKAGDLLLEPVRKTVKERVSVTKIEGVEIVQAALGNNAGVIGVAMWTCEHAG